MSPIPEPQALAIDAPSQPWKRQPVFMFSPFPFRNSDITIPLRSIISTRVHLRLEVVPSPCMEALMQHFQAAGFSEEVSSSQQLLDDPQHMTGGFASLSGPGNKVLIHLVPELLR